MKHLRREVIMRIKLFVTALFLASTLPQPVLAMDGMEEHGSQIFHAFRLKTGYGGGKSGAVASWDFDGWVGGDDNKIWLKSEGENTDGETEKVEFWALYSRNIATFWDAQIGL